MVVVVVENNIIVVAAVAVENNRIVVSVVEVVVVVVEYNRIVAAAAALLGVVVFCKQFCSVVILVYLFEISSAPNFYCCNFNGRAVLWVFPLEFVCKSGVERGTACLQNE